LAISFDNSKCKSGKQILNNCLELMKEIFNRWQDSNWNEKNSLKL